MPKIIDLTGQRFGLLTVVRRDRLPSGVAAWLCKCDCGGERVVRGGHLTEGAIKSCGCVKSSGNTQHGQYRSPEWVCWMNMMQRCANPNNPAYDRYGGAGIGVCERWMSFENFLADMGKRPDGMSIDRIDNDKGYLPDNCRWANDMTQARNRKIVVELEFDGRKQGVSEWADELGIKASVIHTRLWRGWSVEKALTTPI